MAQDVYLRKTPLSRHVERSFDHEGHTYNLFGGDRALATLSYLRSAYKYTGVFNISRLEDQPLVLQDHDRPKRMNDLDQRLVTNYQRIFSQTVSELVRGAYDGMDGRELRQVYMNTINAHLKALLDIRISDVGEPIGGRGQLFFETGVVEACPYANLSAGEKEIVDLILDLVVKSRDFDDTIYCIDEPDIHISTAIQGKLMSGLILCGAQKMSVVGCDAQCWHP